MQSRQKLYPYDLHIYNKGNEENRRWMNGRMDGWMDKWTDGRGDGWMDGWMDWMDVWMDG